MGNCNTKWDTEYKLPTSIENNQRIISNNIKIKQYNSLDNICKMVANISNFPVVCISIIRDDEKKQYFIGKHGIKDNSTSIDDSICKFVINKKKDIIIPDTYITPEYPSKNLGIKTYIGIPIIINNNIEAVLCLFSYRKQKYNRKCIQFLKIISVMVGSKIELMYKIQIDEEKAIEHQNFTKTLSHEINTCLHTVLASAEYFEESCLDNEDKKWSKILSESSNTINNIVQDILLYQKLSHKINSVNSNKLVDTRSYFETLILVSGLNEKIQLFISENIRPYITVNKNLLSRVILNVLNNCKKYSTGKILLWPKITRDGKKLEIEVIDNGPGIKNINKMIKPYEQSSNNNKGIGLGLTLCKQLCESVNGTFLVTNRKDKKGLVVNIKIPILQDKQFINDSDWKSESLINILSKSKELSTNKILIVDDTPICREILKRIILKINPNTIIEEASNGQESIDMCKIYNYRFVFMDYNMPPGINGLEASKQIKSNVIFVTAEILKDKYKNIGKPFCKKKLRSILSQ
tara:strand:- start:4129 stop:5691 length:1563 start_codon:yes stop_codon:yes gene_type:complete